MKWLDLKLLTFGGVGRWWWLWELSVSFQGCCSFLFFLHSDLLASFHYISWAHYLPALWNPPSPSSKHLLFCAGGVISSWHSGPKELWPCATATARGPGRRLWGGVCEDCPPGEEQGAAGEENLWCNFCFFLPFTSSFYFSLKLNQVTNQTDNEQLHKIIATMSR